MYYYRRRVPKRLVEYFHRAFIQFSLDTNNPAEAKKRRTAMDLEWDARFDAAQSATSPTDPDGAMLHGTHAPPLSETDFTKLIQSYVERQDERFRGALTSQPPASREQQKDVETDIEIGLGILRDRDDPRAAELIDKAARNILPR